MSNPVLEGMARAAFERNGEDTWEALSKHTRNEWTMDQRAALLYLAANVSDEMVEAADAVDDCATIDGLRVLIAAALRQAAGGE